MCERLMGMGMYRRLCEAIAGRIVDAADLHELRAYSRGDLGGWDGAGVWRPATAASLRARAARGVVAYAQRRAGA